MTDVLSDLRKHGLIAIPQTNEAFMPPDKDQQDAEDQSDAAKDDNADDQEQDDQEQDQEQNPEEDDSDIIQVPVEIKDKILQMHKLSGEIYGDLTGEDNIKDRYTKFESKSLKEAKKYVIRVDLRDARKALEALRDEKFKYDTDGSDVYVFKNAQDKENALDLFKRAKVTVAESRELKEEVDVQSIIQELISTSWGGDNESQGKAVELLKGLAFSDDPAANAFMQKLDAFTSSLDSSEFGA